jgi:hypothetical protein
MHACEHLLGDDPCVSGFCSWPPSASSPSFRRRRRRTGSARRIPMWGPPWAFASSCATAPRWCTIRIRRHGTCDRSHGRAASAIMRRPGAGAGHGNIGRHSTIGAIASTGRGSGHPVGLTSRIATLSSGCMHPGSMAARHCAMTPRTPGSSTGTAAPVPAAIIDGASGGPAGNTCRPASFPRAKRGTTWEPVMEQRRAGMRKPAVLERGHDCSGCYA